MAGYEVEMRDFPADEDDKREWKKGRKGHPLRNFYGTNLAA